MGMLITLREQIMENAPVLKPEDVWSSRAKAGRATVDDARVLLEANEDLATIERRKRIVEKHRRWKRKRDHEEEEPEDEVKEEAQQSENIVVKGTNAVDETPRE